MKPQNRRGGSGPAIPSASASATSRSPAFGPSASSSSLLLGRIIFFITPFVFLTIFYSMSVLGGDTPHPSDGADDNDNFKSRRDEGGSAVRGEFRNRFATDDNKNADHLGDYEKDVKPDAQKQQRPDWMKGLGEDAGINAGFFNQKRDDSAPLLSTSPSHLTVVKIHIGKDFAHGWLTSSNRLTFGTSVDVIDENHNGDNDDSSAAGGKAGSTEFKSKATATFYGKSSLKLSYTSRRSLEIQLSRGGDGEGEKGHDGGYPFRPTFEDSDGKKNSIDNGGSQEEGASKRYQRVSHFLLLSLWEDRYRLAYVSSIELLRELGLFFSHAKLVELKCGGGEAEGAEKDDEEVRRVCGDTLGVYLMIEYPSDAIFRAVSKYFEKQQSGNGGRALSDRRVCETEEAFAARRRSLSRFQKQNNALQQHSNQPPIPAAIISTRNWFYFEKPPIYDVLDVPSFKRNSSLSPVYRRIEGQMTQFSSQSLSTNKYNGAEGDTNTQDYFDLSLYLSWMGVNTLLKNGDYDDEVFFYGISEGRSSSSSSSLSSLSAGPVSTAKYFAVMAWDYDSVFGGCHRKGANAAKSNVVFCGETPIEKTVVRHVDALASSLKSSEKTNDKRSDSISSSAILGHDYLTSLSCVLGSVATVVKWDAIVNRNARLLQSLLSRPRVREVTFAVEIAAASKKKKSSGKKSDPADESFITDGAKELITLFTDSHAQLTKHVEGLGYSVRESAADGGGVASVAAKGERGEKVEGGGSSSSSLASLSSSCHEQFRHALTLSSSNVPPAINVRKFIEREYKVSTSDGSNFKKGASASSVTSWSNSLRSLFASPSSVSPVITFWTPSGKGIAATADSHSSSSSSSDLASYTSPPNAFSEAGLYCVAVHEKQALVVTAAAAASRALTAVSNGVSDAQNDGVFGTSKCPADTAARFLLPFVIRDKVKGKAEFATPLFRKPSPSVLTLPPTTVASLLDPSSVGANDNAAANTMPLLTSAATALKVTAASSPHLALPTSSSINDNSDDTSSGEGSKKLLLPSRLYATAPLFWYSKHVALPIALQGGGGMASSSDRASKIKGRRFPVILAATREPSSSRLSHHASSKPFGAEQFSKLVRENILLKASFVAAGDASVADGVAGDDASDENAINRESLLLRGRSVVTVIASPAVVGGAEEKSSVDDEGSLEGPFVAIHKKGRRSIKFTLRTPSKSVLSELAGGGAVESSALPPPPSVIAKSPKVIPPLNDPRWTPFMTFAQNYINKKQNNAHKERWDQQEDFVGGGGGKGGDDGKNEAPPAAVNSDEKKETLFLILNGDGAGAAILKGKDTVVRVPAGTVLLMQGSSSKIVLDEKAQLFFDGTPERPISILAAPPAAAVQKQQQQQNKKKNAASNADAATEDVDADDADDDDIDDDAFAPVPPTPWDTILVRGGAQLSTTYCFISGSGVAGKLEPSTGKHHSRSTAVTVVGASSTALLSNTFFVYLQGAAISSGNHGTVVANDCVIQWAELGIECVRCDFTSRRSLWALFPSWTTGYADDDNDGMYLSGGVHTVTDSVIAHTKDDGIDTGTPEKFEGGDGGSLTVSNTIFEMIQHEAIALSSAPKGTRTVTIEHSLIQFAQQGVEVGYSNSDLKTNVKHVTIRNCAVGARYGDNYRLAIEGEVRFQHAAFENNGIHAMHYLRKSAGGLGSGDGEGGGGFTSAKAYDPYLAEKFSFDHKTCFSLTGDGYFEEKSPCYRAVAIKIKSAHNRTH